MCISFCRLMTKQTFSGWLQKVMDWERICSLVLMKLNFSKQLWQCRRFSEYQVLIRNLTKFSFNYNMQRMEAMSLLGVALILSRYFPSCYQSQMWVTYETAIFHTFVFSCISATSRVASMSSTTRGQVLFLSHSYNSRMVTILYGTSLKRRRKCLKFYALFVEHRLFVPVIVLFSYNEQL